MVLHLDILLHRVVSAWRQA